MLTSVEPPRRWLLRFDTPFWEGAQAQVLGQCGRAREHISEGRGRNPGRHRQTSAAAGKRSQRTVRPTVRVAVLCVQMSPRPCAGQPSPQATMSRSVSR